ncbi:MAG: hypothetical protein N3B18_03460 [Desulfobacterota bacterium]|nr:hypothetical protein [Thermodesulfobacteriota bacterium]
MRFLMIDRICELEPGVHARGIKNISWDCEFLEEFFPGIPVFSPVIAAEAAAQLVSWAIITARDFTVKPVITIVDSYRCSGHFHPGDQIEVCGTIERMADESGLAHGTLQVRGRTVLEIRHAVCYLYPLVELDPPDRARQQFNNLYLPGAPLPDPTQCGTFVPAREQVPLPQQRWIDRIVASSDRSIVGIKNFTATADYFNDHFPNKPVVPGVIIIQSMISLAKHLADHILASVAGSEKRVVLMQSEKIKFRTFIRPGDQLLIQADLKAWGDSTSSFVVSGTINGKNVASLRLFFDHVTRDEYIQRYCAGL